MGRVVVTVISAAGWLAAIALVVRLRETRHEARRPTAGSGPLQDALATVSGAIAAALLSGVLVLGLGGRLLMRLLAATSPASAQGRLTEAEEIVGEVTLGGTIGLLVFVGAFGGLAGLVLYAPLRRWLPDRSIAAGLLTAGIGAAVLARMSGLLDPENRDFEILTPTWLAVALALFLVVTFALLAAILIDRWSARWPTPGLSVKGIASLAPLVITLVPPAVVFTVLAVVYLTWRNAAGGPLLPQRASRVLQPALLIVAVAGTGWLAVTSVQVLTA